MSSRENNIEKVERVLEKLTPKERDEIIIEVARLLRLDREYRNASLPPEQQQNAVIPAGECE